jgi:hypothetical protein
MNEHAEPFSLEAVWEALRLWARAMVNALGEPASIAAGLLLPRAIREDILAFLAPLEAGVRRLLLIEAAALPRPNEAPVPVSRGRVSANFREDPVRALPEDSREWRCSFRLWPAATRSETPRQTPTIRATKRVIHYNAFPLARRIEAVIRVLEDRAAYVAKIARRLHADPVETRAAFRPFHARAPSANFLLRDIHRETELALETLNSS